MKHSILILTTFCFCTMMFSQENRLFSSQEQDFLENLTIRKDDTSLLYKKLFDDNALVKHTFSLPDYKLIYQQDVFNKSENSAIKQVMPVYEPRGNWKQKSIFPDNSMHHLLLIKPVKER